MREGHQEEAETGASLPAGGERCERENIQVSEVSLMVVGMAGIQAPGNGSALGGPRKTSCTATREKAGKGGWIGSSLKEFVSQHTGGAQ